MSRREYDKLVRDRIPEIICENGQRPLYDVVGREEALEYLAAKLSEEAAEYRADRNPEELADVLEVVRGILLHSGMTWEDMENIRKRKYDQRGGFEKRIRLIAVDDENE